jgi:hypothetical protein
MGNTSVMDKLRKLIAHEQSAQSMGSQAEAEAFADRIAEMLIKHKLERSDVEVQAETAEPIGKDTVKPEDFGGKVPTSRTKAVAWQVSLAQGVCSATGCGLLWSTYDGGAVFCGKSADRESAKGLYCYMGALAIDQAWKIGQKEKPAIIREVKRMWGETSFGHQSQAMKVWRESYLTGFANEVASRLRETVKQEMVKAEGSTAMVHVRKDQAAVEAFIHNTSSGKKGCDVGSRFGRMNYDAYSKGQDHGQKVALTDKVLA